MLPVSSIASGQASSSWPGSFCGSRTCGPCVYPSLERLGRASNETVSLYIRMGDQRVCIEEFESGQEIRDSQTVGLTAPLHVGAPGKALLAFLPPGELEALLATLLLTGLTSHTLHGPRATPGGTGYGAPARLCGDVGERSPWASSGSSPYPGLERATPSLPSACSAPHTVSAVRCCPP